MSLIKTKTIFSLSGNNLLCFLHKFSQLNFFLSAQEKQLPPHLSPQFRFPLSKLHFPSLLVVLPLLTKDLGIAHLLTFSERFSRPGQ